jgi:lipoate-protein ligase A
MAVDEAILEASGRGDSFPTLRLYAWEPACLSLGYAQPYTDVNVSGLENCGWEVVRRPTGGRAILHTDELTYSVAAPLNEPHLAGSLLESYRCISQALLTALRSLGLPVEAPEKPPVLPVGGVQEHNAPKDGPVCFEVPSNFEITWQGKKLIGNAQARRKEGVLQHGSLPLVGDLRRITWALRYPDENSRRQAADRLLLRATTVEAVLGQAPSWEACSQAFIHAFQDVFGIEFVQNGLAPYEIRRAEQLVLEKYANSVWTERV